VITPKASRLTLPDPAASGLCDPGAGIGGIALYTKSVPFVVELSC